VASGEGQDRARRKAGRRRLLSTAFSLACHGAALTALLLARGPPPPPPEPEPMQVALVDPRPPAPTNAPACAPAPPAAAQPPPPRNLARRTPPRPEARPVPAGEGKADDPGVELSDAQLASAAQAGGGGGSGRPCDMARRLQAALRKDARVQAAVAEARGQGAPSKALFVWNGEWIRSSGQEGNGLAAVREAMMWEIGFAPEACRAEPVHGLVAFSLNDSPGGARLVVGSGVWRWSDLLRPRTGG
jgi:hypothetical protein